MPELVTSGYVFESAEEARALAQPVDGPALSDWAEEAARTEAVVIGGFAELGADGAVYNSAAVVRACRTAGRLPEDAPLGPREALLRRRAASRRLS